MKVQQVAHLCIFVLFLLSSPALSQEANSQKCIGSEPPPWSIADLRAALPEFKRIYVGRPQGRNLHGIGINHAFALWATIRYVKPLIVIESGVYMGQGTYFIRQAAGPEAAIYCLDPRHDHQLLEGNIYRDTSPRTSYYTGSTFRDFGDLPWLQLIPQHARARTLLVLDDHMSAIKRVQQALGFGFEHIWYEDNSGPDYSFGRMCSRRPVPLRVVYADNFGTVSHNISREEHEANVAYIKRRLKKYYEFPPIFTPYGSRQQLLGREEAQNYWNSIRMSSPACKELNFTRKRKRKCLLGIYGAEWSTAYPPYVQLHQGPIKDFVERTTPARLACIGNRFSRVSGIGNKLKHEGALAIGVVPKGGCGGVR